MNKNINVGIQCQCSGTHKDQGPWVPGTHKDVNNSESLQVTGQIRPNTSAAETKRQRQTAWRLKDNIFNVNFVKENCILTKKSLKCILSGLINNMPELF